MILFLVVCCLTVLQTSGKWTCASRKLASLPYCNSSLPTLERVRDLVVRMTLSEKVDNMHVSGDGESSRKSLNTFSYFQLAGIPRLGVPGVPVMECLHGVGVDRNDFCVNQGRTCPTSFPVPVGMSASFNETLWALVGSAVGKEARALGNMGKAGAGLFVGHQQ